MGVRLYHTRPDSARGLSRRYWCRFRHIAQGFAVRCAASLWLAATRRLFPGSL